MQQYLDNEEQTVDEFEADLEKRVRDAVAAQFVLDQIAKVEKIGVNEGELQAHLMRRAQQSGQNPQEFISHMLEHNHIPEMVSEVVRGKALASVVEGATVTDASGNPVELKNLQPDGSIAEPGESDPGTVESDAVESHAVESDAVEPDVAETAPAEDAPAENGAPAEQAADEDERRDA